MRTIETKIFTFDELNDKAKEKARDWYRSIDDFEPDYIIEDFQRICDILGFSITMQTEKLHGGGTRQKPTVYWDLGRGASASFAGWYRYKPGCSKAIRKYAPTDNVLHGIAEDLFTIQSKAKWSIVANINPSQNMNGLSVEPCDTIREDLELGLRLTVLRFSKWLHDQLKAEFEHQSSDEYIDDMLRVNEYEFTEKGEHYL